MKIIYKTVVTFTILSENPVEIDRVSGDFYASCDENDWIGGDKNIILNQELVGKVAVNEINNLGSNPEFFQLDCEGNVIPDEEIEDIELDIYTEE